MCSRGHILTFRYMSKPTTDITIPNNTTRQTRRYNNITKQNKLSDGWWHTVNNLKMLGTNAWKLDDPDHNNSDPLTATIVIEEVDEYMIHCNFYK